MPGRKNCVLAYANFSSLVDLGALMAAGRCDVMVCAETLVSTRRHPAELRVTGYSYYGVTSVDSRPTARGISLLFASLAMNVVVTRSSIWGFEPNTWTFMCLQCFQYIATLVLMTLYWIACSLLCLIAVSRQWAYFYHSCAVVSLWESNILPHDQPLGPRRCFSGMPICIQVRPWYVRPAEVALWTMCCRVLSIAPLRSGLFSLIFRHHLIALISLDWSISWKVWVSAALCCVYWNSSLVTDDTEPVWTGALVDGRMLCLVYLRVVSCGLFSLCCTLLICLTLSTAKYTLMHTIQHWWLLFSAHH